MTLYEHDSTLANVVGLTDAHGSWARHFGNADLVIEAVFEELSVKHKVVEQMEAVTPERCIIATNTSTLPIGDIAQHAKRPQNIVGMHYFSPAEIMQLLEVIPHAGTDEKVTAAAVDVGIKQGKTVISVKDVPGFYVNRCIGAQAAPPTPTWGPHPRLGAPPTPGDPTTLCMMTWHTFLVWAGER